jgi:hypothetical protein
MDTPTPNLKLPQFEATDPFDFPTVNQMLLDIDRKLAVTTCTTATRPTGTDRFDGRVVYDTDIGKYIKWASTANQWRSVDFGGSTLPSITLTPGAGITLSTSPTPQTFNHKNGIANIHFSFSYNAAIGAGDIANFTVATMPMQWVPENPTVLHQGLTGPLISYYLSPLGVITMTSTSAAITQGFVMSCAGIWIMT